MNTVSPRREPRNEHLLFSVNSEDKDFIIYNAEPLSDEPINLKDLRYLETQDMDAQRSEAWSANVKWFFVIQPEGVYLLNVKNKQAVFCPTKSNVFIELFLQKVLTKSKKKAPLDPESKKTNARNEERK